MSTYTILQRFAALDRKITILSVQNEDLTKLSKQRSSELAKECRLLEQLESESQKLRAEIALEEKKLQEHEDHVISQRKQLSTLGGAKSAKYVEREADLASRAASVIEEQLLVEMQKSQELDVRLNAQRSKVKVLEENCARENAERAAIVAQNQSELEKFTRERSEGQIDDSAKRLYDRVRTKHPAQPLALVEGGSCKVCSRSIPAQIVNLVLAGGVLQVCPGCSRILVPAEEHHVSE